MKKWFVIAFVITLVVRSPSLIEPYWYGDEGIYLTIGQAISRGSVLYKDIHDNKPPLIYYVAAMAGGEMEKYRFIAWLWNAATVGVMAMWVYTLWPKKKILGWGVVIGFMALTNLPLFEGNVANGEIFFLLPTMLGSYLLWTAENKIKRIFIAGICFGVAGLFKVPAIVEVGIWPVYWWVYERKNWWKNNFWLVIGVIIPIFISVMYFWNVGVLGGYFGAALGQNVGYVSSWGTDNLGGIYTLKARAVVAGLILLAYLFLGKRLDKFQVVGGGWFSLAVFGSLISGRPYPHYLLQIMGSLCLMMGYLFTRFEMKKIVLGLVGIVGIIEVAIVMSEGKIEKFPVYSVTTYYERYIKLAGKRIDKQEFNESFDWAVKTNYQIAADIDKLTTKEDKVFIWGDQPIIYAIAQRLPVGKYTAGYHIKDFRAQEQTIKLLRSELPKIIVNFGDEQSLPGFEDLLKKNYSVLKRYGQTELYRRVEPV